MLGLGLTQYVPFAVYLGIFVALFLSLFYKTSLGLLFLVPLIPQQVVWGKLWDYPLGQHLILIMTIIFLFCTLLQKQDDVIRKGVFTPAILLIIITFIGLFIGSSSFPLTLDNGYFKIWVNFVIMPLLFIVVYKGIHEGWEMRLIVFLMALSMFANYFYFKSSFMWFSSEHYEHTMRVSTFKDLGPNEMASMVVQGTIIFSAIFFVYKKFWSRLFMGLVILGNFYVILYSYSRAGYLALFTGLVFIGILRKNIILLLVLIAVLMSWSRVLPPSVVERLQMTVQQDDELDHASAIRLVVWKEGLSTFASNPMGAGFAKYRSLGLGEARARDAHNMIVKMLVEMGIPGVAIYLLIYIWSFKSGWRLFRTAPDEFRRALGLALMGCVLANFISNMFGQDWTLLSVTSNYWVLWALAERSLAMLQADALVLEKEKVPILIEKRAFEG